MHDMAEIKFYVIYRFVYNYKTHFGSPKIIMQMFKEQITKVLMEFRIAGKMGINLHANDYDFLIERFNHLVNYSHTTSFSLSLGVKKRNHRCIIIHKNTIICEGSYPHLLNFSSLFYVFALC